MIDQFKAARRVSTPIVAISTPDAAATIAAVLEQYRKTAPPALEWRLTRGFAPCNEAGKTVLAQLVPAGDELVLAELTNPGEALKKAAELPEKAFLFIHNAQFLLQEPAAVQAIWDLRDQFKTNQRTLVLMGPGMKLPPELAQDVVTLDEPLPDAEQLRAIVVQTLQDGKLEPDEETTAKAITALTGLSAYAAEQATAMSLTNEGLDVPALWARKRSMIASTPGLTVYDGPEDFSTIGGCAQVKRFISGVLTGKRAPAAIVFIDEIEKAMGGGQGDTSGVSQDQLAVLLSYTQQYNAPGLLFIGPPGTAKSAIAKAAGNEAGIPTIQLDLGAAKGSLVGQSEQQLRNALKVVTAVSNGRPLFIATCNSLTALPPELRRRFALGTWFFDLPTADERAAIWAIYLLQFNLVAQPPKDDHGWTGAEIRTCCDVADRLEVSIKDSAAYIVPVATSAKQRIDQIRKEASGRYLSASSPGVYAYSELAAALTETTLTRKISTEDT